MTPLITALPIFKVCINVVILYILFCVFFMRFKLVAACSDYSFLLLCTSISLYKYTTNHISILLLIFTWAVLNCWLLKRMLLWIFLSEIYMSLSEHMHAFLLWIFLAVLGHGFCVWSTLLDTRKQFSKVIVPISTLPSSI